MLQDAFGLVWDYHPPGKFLGNQDQLDQGYNHDLVVTTSIDDVCLVNLLRIGHSVTENGVNLGMERQDPIQVKKKTHLVCEDGTDHQSHCYLGR